ncbi:MAG: hypothetical protein JXR83_12105, partial [Deltaproteobacteria bacterium]|nr:hypothetical protein [Deltaproteobacteria bacterium]
MQSARSRDLSWRRHAARATAAACAAAAAIALALLGLPLVFGHYYYGLDQTQTNVGLLCAIERLLAQDAPLWLSPAVGNGAPLLTRPEAALFYPVRWLALLLPPDAGASLEAVLHLALAAAGATWLGRTFGLRPAAALAAGLATAFSGSYLDLLLHTSIYPAGGAWLPWVWAAARRALHPGGRAG